MPIGSHWSQVETLEGAPRLGADEIEAQQFDTVQRGYDPAAVVAFLRQVSKAYRDLVEEAAALRRDLETHTCPEPVEVVREVPAEVRSDGDQYERMSEEVAAVLRAAYETADQVRHQAKQEADARLEELRQHVEEQEQVIERTRRQADIEAEARRQRSEEDARALVASAREEQQRVEQATEEHVAAVRNEQRELRERLNGAAAVLDELLGTVSSVAAEATAPPPD